ncbi:MAG: NUDIX domain-containing protein [Candidatus Pacebacteria bacterium]|jgi:8-oxo-dGTP pyrophosphatase MutT (NUDIX family)|nr:NUDIX domain-containing protein [Candidatus Paceibacterota bacterium]MBT4651876.1 NUDIX domain-containing protein [Candidatus Paceibacterota bacterium]MBT6755696.1 NUDIX domain-containing protein [Candidatus Paceibacterota bacterium]MBT6921202.1 NUDIX domain-containing protein [Candidatus Paceibacterota bacterium]
MKKTIYSVTNFLHYKDEYLFIHRTKRTNKVDGNRLNGIGGKLEPKENFLQAAIRETQEETGFVVTEDNIKLAGVVRMQGGYEDDWMMCFFKIEVSSKEVPLGLENDEGELIWLPADKVLTSGYELVDDLNYCFQDIVAGKIPFMAHAEVDEHEKVKNWNVSYS